MALKTSHELHHYFPKIAEESGFTFNNHRPRVHLNWSKIRLIDIDNLIRERKFSLIEQHLNDILDCVFESEFDMQILDEGVLKLFRLAQLTVEYQQFCRQYLDRSVYILRQEITAMAQDLESTKKTLEEKEEELRKLRRRTRHSYKTPLPYGNDNIANMILKTLSNRADLFPSTSNLDTHQYNKCKYCDKVFMNQLYLQSHIDRRHANIIELPQKEIDADLNQKFNSEIDELKKKLKEMEEVIATANNKTTSIPKTNNDDQNKCANIKETIENHVKINTQKTVKNAEVSTNNDEYFISKLEEWKKEEQEKHIKEITNLKIEILDTINSFKNMDKSTIKTNSESNLIEQLEATIKQQGAEILTLKEELNIYKIKSEKDIAEKYQEAESRVAFWIQKAETQAKQYESLLEKLNDIAKDAKESRALAEVERQRANNLEEIMKRNLKQKEIENIPARISSKEVQSANDSIKTAVKECSPKNSNKDFKRDSLEKLHKRAQELLYIDSVSSTSTDDVSSVEKISTSSPKKLQPEKIQDETDNRRKVIKNDKTKRKENNIEQIQSLNANVINKLTAKNKLKPRHTEEKPKAGVKVEKERITSINIPESPLKIVRAKLTQEVNNRLILAGVDPLKSRLSQSIFRKQHAQLQQQKELKSKKNPSIDKVRNLILTYLDENTSSVKKDSKHINKHVPSRNTAKPFLGFSSVIENVKSKALYLVKGNDMGVINEKRQSLSAEVSKKAMSLLKTPLDSISTSPQTIKSPTKMIPVVELPKNTMNKIKQTNELLINSEESLYSNLEDSEISDKSDNKYYDTSVVHIISKSTDNLLKSPARRPASASPVKNTVKKYTITDDNETHLIHSQSAAQLINKINTEPEINIKIIKQDPSTNEQVISELDAPLKKANPEETVKQTKGVLKNASSTSSLNKKKVIFDMDAIQMKSLSASPSQSITEKIDNHRYDLGLVNLGDTEEWDISSIESDPLQNDTKIRFSTATAPKIAELKKKLESQLARRNERPTTLVGSVDVLGGSLTKAANIGGSNTSLGSSTNESESGPVPNHRTIITSKKIITKTDSDLDISELSNENLDNKKESF